MRDPRALLCGAVLLLQGCMIQYPNLRHEDWSGTLPALRQDRERLDLSVVSNQLDLDVEFVDRDGRIVRSYRRQGSYEAWLGWVFLFWGLAFFDDEAETHVLVDMSRDITREIYSDDYGFFAEQASE